MNLGRVAGFGCCRFQCARREEGSEYHGSDDCNSFHVSGILFLVTVRPSVTSRLDKLFPPFIRRYAHVKDQCCARRVLAYISRSAIEDEV